jgi:uncharacterized protein (DUF488 family)
MPEMLPVFTIGHSTRSIVEFAALLQTGGVQLVVDIRSVPKSRTNPQYNLDALPDALAEFQVAHMRFAELGGLRKKSGMPADANALWRNQSFHNYADYALSQPFRSGLAHLLQVSAERRTAIMCAEAVWWRCHRRIVADYLIKEGRRVFHLMSETTVSAASMTPGAIEAADGLHYPAQELGAATE